jgi:hypothetical protein
MLSAYFDESGIQDGSTVVVLAGLLASPRQWEILSGRWSRTLLRFGISAFKAADCANGAGEFRGWTNDDRKALVVPLISTIQQTVSYRVWTAVSVEDYKSAPYVPGGPRIYALAAIGCASCVRVLAAQRGKTFRVPYVFDQGRYGGIIFHNFERLLNKGMGGFFAMGAISRGDHRLMVPLQAADMFAYELYRYISDQILRTGRPIRRSMDALLSVKDGGGYFLGGRKLHMLRRGVAEQQRTGVLSPIAIGYDRLDKKQGLRIERKLQST